MTEKTSKGLIYVFTGDGKGKTTAALGLAIRAVGHDMKVAFIQFIKGIPSGEFLYMSKHHPFDIVQISSGNSFSKSMEQLGQEAQLTFDYAKKEILSGKYNVVVLDEVFVAISKGLISTEQVLDLLDEKPDPVELILTGRGAPAEIIERADLVTEMHMIKHPFTKGITGRRGIEY